jgi:2-keto-4-pentenoate hydratase/2-oxohepta-3-ene-1,7-dioic acid hydratase in catechol pathway
VRASELVAALAACGGEGLGIALDVDEGDGFRPRQDSNTKAMILDPLALLGRIADEVALHGVVSSMPRRDADGERTFRLAVASPDRDSLVLPAGSIVLTGTPDGVAMHAPSPLAITLRGMLHLRGPLAQFRHEELARAASGGPGAYLEPGDRVRARIGGLGAQIVRIAEPGAAQAPDPCGAHPEV